MKADSQAFKHLRSGGLLLVESRETVRVLRQSYDRAQRRAALRAWTTARIATLDDWLADLWRQSRAQWRDQRILRADSQVLRLLERIIERDPGAPLLNLAATTDAALRAWRRLHDWCLDWPLPPSQTDEERAFARWAEALDRAEREGGWIDRARLAALVAADPPRLLAGERLLVLGFDPEPPALQRLFAAITRSGATVERAPASRPASHAYLCRPPTVDDEWRQAAEWARDLSAADPDAELAIIVPDLASHRSIVRATFDRIIDPARLLATAARPLPLYSMIGGAPLSDQPIVATALKLLSLGRDEIRWSEASQLLRSPHIGGWLEESGARARFDRALREEGRANGSVNDLMQAAHAAGCTRWGSLAAALRIQLAPVRSRAAASQWAQRFSRALRAGGWGEGRKLASEEFQAAERLRELLADLAALDTILPPLDFESARFELDRLCRETGYQPESGEPRVHVLDAIDHPGSCYSGLWITGLMADRWPRGADPDPFLPIALQRSAGMPWPSAAAQLALAQRAASRLATAADVVVWSAPAQVEDSPAEASPLIPVGLPAWPAISSTRTTAEILFDARRSEIIKDEGPPLASGIDRLRGGARVLELQAKCAFRAFGEQRLHARRLESPRPGIARSLRGELAHRALEIFWRQVESQSALRALGEDGRRAQVRSATSQAGRELGAQVPPALLALELDWLRRAMQALLAVELERTPFTVQARELTERLRVGGIALDFRIDRIDGLAPEAGGGEFLLDYKTGRARTPRWLGAGRDMPQLPAYAVARADLGAASLAGIAIVQLNLHEPGFRGVAATDAGRRAIAEPKAATSARRGGSGLADWLDDWRSWTESLVEAHRAGDAQVRPLSREVCRECALATLCRIGGDWPPDEETDDDDGS